MTDIMITQEMIDRINVLARKSKTAEGLTDAEKEEQQVLRRAYRRGDFPKRRRSASSR